MVTVIGIDAYPFFGFSVKVTKITSRIGVSQTHSLPFCL